MVCVLGGKNVKQMAESSSRDDVAMLLKVIVQHNDQTQKKRGKRSKVPTWNTGKLTRHRVTLLAVSNFPNQVGAQLLNFLSCNSLLPLFLHDLIHLTLFTSLPSRPFLTAGSVVSSVTHPCGLKLRLVYFKR